MIEDFSFEHPIILLDKAQTASDYHTIPIVIDDSRNSEPLVDIENYCIGGQSYYARIDGKNVPYNRAIPGALKRVWCRQSVAKKLQKVNARLQPIGYELFVWDAYRPISCQQGLWNHYIELARNEHRKAMQAELRRIVLQYVSDPTFFVESNPTTWPTHCTGAAVDLTLRCLATGQLVDMGTHFDDMRLISHSDYFERLFNQGKIGQNDERLRNRRMLYNAMMAEGFVNYHYEFWHFDWGNQMYIMNLRHHSTNVPAAAWYGYIKPPKV